MTPSTGRVGCVSGQELRRHAAEVLKREVSAGQLRALRDHGFITELGPGCWAPEAKDALVKALRLVRKAKHLDRRSLYRFMEDVDSIPTPQLKANMVSVLARLTAPVKKLCIVMDGMKDADLNVPHFRSRVRVAELRGTLQHAELADLQRTATAALHLSSYITAHRTASSDTAGSAGINALEPDERLVLLTLAGLLRPPSDRDRRAALNRYMRGDLAT